MTEAEALSKFVAGEISFGALRNALAGSIDFVFEPSGTIEVTYKRQLPKAGITAEDIARMLRRYQNGETTLEELATWGLVIHNLNAFELEHRTEMQREAVWDVIGELSVASVNTAFDEDRASELQEQLTVLGRGS